MLVPALPAQNARVRRCESVVALGVAAAVNLVFVADAMFRHALGAARNDDWSYLRTAFALDRTGVVHLNGWASTNFVGQLLITRPVVALAPDNIAALQLATATMGALGLWAWYLVLRRMLTPALAACACFTVAACPWFGSLSVSYMTDVPTLFIVGVSLLFGSWACEGPPAHRLWFCLACLSSVIAFSIREYAITAFAAIAVAYVIDRPRARPFALTVALIVGFTCATVWVWRHHLPFDHRIPVVVQPLRPSIRILARVLLTFGFMLIPMSAMLSPRRALAAASRAAGWVPPAALLATSLCLLVTWRQPFVGNYLTREGPVGSGLRMNAIVWVLMVAAAAWALFLAALVVLPASLAIGRTLRDHLGAPLPVPLFAVTYAALLAAVLLMTPTMFDRYLLLAAPAIAGVVLLLAHGGGLLLDRGWLPVALFIGLAYAAVGFAYVDVSAEFDGARWELGKAAVAAGAAAAEVDADWEWYAFHQGTQAKSPTFNGPRPWVRWFDGNVCRQVLVAQAAGPILATSRVRSPLLGSVLLYLTIGPDPCGRERE